MLDFNHSLAISQTKNTPEELRVAVRAKIAELDDAIEKIKTQLAAADMRRQERRGRLDADWYHKARTAMRHLQRERAELIAVAASLPDPRAELKDRIIALARTYFDPADWESIVEQAQTFGNEERN